MSIRKARRSVHWDLHVTAPHTAWTRGRDESQELSDAQLHRKLDALKDEITKQSKQNFVLESEVRRLDGRIALLIANRMSAYDLDCGTDEHAEGGRDVLDDERLQLYSNMFYLLMTEPQHIAMLCRLVSSEDLDMFLQTVMFTIYANQYDDFEEHFLLSVFQSVLSANFKTASHIGTILRANTPLSRMMSTYTRRGPGQTYVKSVLSKYIDGVLSPSFENLEIDPALVHNELTNEGKVLPSTAEPAKHPLVHARIQARTDKLVRIAQAMLRDVFRSVDRVPYGIRWICKQIRCLTRRSQPGVAEDVLSSLVGSFFFLRYLNVAIVSPESYLVSSEKRSKHGRRTLIFLAKIIQHLVNNPSHVKGDLAMRLRPFVVAHRARMVEFLHELCNVNDFYGALELYHYINLSKHDRKLHITMNEMFFMHGLILKHVDVLALDMKSHLSQVMTDLGAAPALVKRDENYTLELLLFTRYEDSMLEFTSTLMNENSMSASEILYMETKSLFLYILQLLPHSRRGFDLTSIAMDAKGCGIKHLEVLGQRALVMLHELDALHVADRARQNMLMMEEIFAELASLDSANARSKLIEDQQSLESVLRALQKHYEYLQTQYETYKAYLRNVRCSSSMADERDMNTSMFSVLSRSGRESRCAKKRHSMSAHWYTYEQFEREGIIDSSFIPPSHIPHVSFHVSSPSPGSFLISVNYTGRANAFMEIDIKLDDILESLHRHQETLDAEYIWFNANRLHVFLDQLYGFTGRKW